MVRAGVGAMWLTLACSVYDLPAEPTGAAGSFAEAGATAGREQGGRSGQAGTAGATSGVAGASPEPPLGGSAGSEIGSGGAAGDGGFGAEGGVNGEAGAPSPEDECPSDPAKLVRGKCGCGVPDVSTAELSSCDSLIAKLVHRYDFEGTGTSVRDRIGTAHGTLRGASLSKLEGRGVVLLGGGNAGGYVDLPNQLVSSLTSASFEAWLTWGGGNSWQRIFDFGDSTHASPENNPASGKSYLFVTPKDMSGKLSLAFASGVAGSSEQATAGTEPLPLSLAQVVAVMDSAADEMRLFLNGHRVSTGTWTGALSALNDVNVWLGRSQFEQDPELSAVFHEFRIYGSALTEPEVAAAFIAGPDPSFLTY